MEIRFHKRVQHDLDGILDRYYAISEELGESFFAEFQLRLRKVEENPRYFHFDQGSGLHRCNLDRFPYHFLYDIKLNYVRIWVLRHDRRRPSFGARRFNS